MGEDATDFVLDLAFGPVLMLSAEECRLMATARSVKSSGGLPPLVRGHPPKDGELFGAGLFVGQHAFRLPQAT